MPVSEEVGLLSPRTPRAGWLPHSHTDACSSESPLYSGNPVSWVRDLHHAVRHCLPRAQYRLALTSCVPGGAEEGFELPVVNPSCGFCGTPRTDGRLFFSLSLSFNHCLSDSESVCISESLLFPCLSPSLSLFPPCFPLCLCAFQTLSPLLFPTSASFSPPSFAQVFHVFKRSSYCLHPFLILPPNGHIMPLKFRIFSNSPSYSFSWKREFLLREFEIFALGEREIWVHMIFLSIYLTLPNDDTYHSCYFFGGEKTDSAGTQVRCCNPTQKSLVEVLQNSTCFNRFANYTHAICKQTIECLQASLKQCSSG